MLRQKGSSMKNGRTTLRKSRYLVGVLALFVYTLTLYFTAETEAIALPQEDALEHAKISLYSNQTHDDLRKTLTDAILHAKTTITCIIYSLSDDEIIYALKKQSETGVDVLIVCDAVATQDAHKKLGSKVKLVPVRKKGLMHN